MCALAAVAATTIVSAQSVELYGRFDLGHQSSKVTDGNETTKINSLAGAQDSRTGSRLGFRGTEDLGGGLKASFVYEFGINADRTGVENNARTRLANLAVSGGFGGVAIGTQNNVFDDMTGASVSNLLGTPPVLDGTGAVTGGAIVLTPGRSENAIAYQSPTFNGLSVGVGINRESLKVTGEPDTSFNGTLLNARYSSGPLSVLVGHSIAKDKDGGDDGKFNETAIKASYNLGMAVPYIVMGNSKTKENGATVGKTNGYELGATFPMGAFTPFASFARNSLTLGADKSKYRGNAFGVTYSLSKRTSAYAQVANSKWKDVDYKARLTQVGLIHTF